MRTTISIDDGLLRTAKQFAQRRGLTLGALIEEAIRQYLVTSEELVEEGPPLPFFTRGTGMAPGIDPTSNASMLDALDDEDDHIAGLASRAAG